MTGKFRKEAAILAIILIIIVLLILTRNHSPFGRNNTSFGVEAVSDITRIEMSDGSESLTLSKENDMWLLDGKLETRRSSISFIITILREMNIKSPVTGETFKTTISENGIKPVKVRIYKKRKLLTEFLVYKTGSNIYGNFMKKKPSSKPYIVHVPGFDNDIGSAFTLNKLYWQPYTIFNLLPSEILSVRFEAADSSDSFSIVRENNMFLLSGMKDELTGWDSALVKRYISYFTYIPFESWATDLGEDEVRNITTKTPAYRIMVRTDKGTTKILTLWERKNPDGNTDTDRLYGSTESMEKLFIVRYFDIDPLLKKRDYFFERD